MTKYSVVPGGPANGDPEYLIAANLVPGGTVVLSLSNSAEAQTVCDYLNVHGAGRMSAAQVHDIQVARQKYADSLAQLRLVAVRGSPVTVQIGSWIIPANRCEPLRPDLVDMLLAELEDTYDELLALGFDAGPLPADISGYLAAEALGTSIPETLKPELSDDE